MGGRPASPVIEERTVERTVRIRSVEPALAPAGVLAPPPAGVLGDGAGEPWAVPHRQGQPGAGGVAARLPAARGVRVVLYGHDTSGFGHLRRNLAIAHRLARDLPDAHF